MIRKSLLVLVAAFLASSCADDACNGECPQGTVCDPVALACVPEVVVPDAGASCALDTECSAPTPHCLTTTSSCVECTEGSQCRSGRCAADHTCETGGCTRTQDCISTAGKPFCAASGDCVECLTDLHCPPKDGKTWRCDRTQNACVEAPCTKDVDCDASPVGKVCDVANGVCVGCLRDDNCANPTHCKPVALVCVACVVDADCKEEEGYRCGTDNRCRIVGCANDAACVGTERCEPVSRECVTCLTNADCHFGGSCSAGKCLAPSSCATENDCFFPQKCGAGACVECLSTDDCRNGQTCTNGRCAEPSTCTNGAQCGSGRVCSAGVCVAATCAPDTFEPNEDPSTAKAVAPGDYTASLCPNETDTFLLSFGEGAGASAVVKFDAAAAAPTLELVAAGDGGRVLVTGTAAPGEVRATLEIAPPGTKALLVRIRESAGTAFAYTLKLTTSDTGLCANDAREPDDAQAQAHPVSPGVFDGTLCPTPELDWYVLDVPADFRALASLTLHPVPPATDPPPVRSASVEIYTMVGGRLTRDDYGSQQATGRIAAPAGGAKYWVIVRSLSSQKVKYDLRLDVAPKAPDNDACTSPSLLRHNESVTGHVKGALDDKAVSCVTGSGADAFWRLDLERTSKVTLKLVADFDAALALRATCDVADAACTENPAGNETLTFDGLTAGSWLVQVEAVPGRYGNYTLSSVVDTAAPAGLGESCDAPELLTFTNGGASAAGNVAAMADDVPSVCGRSGGDATYVVELTEPKRIRARLTGFPGASLSLVDEGSCAAMTGATCRETRVKAGTYEAILDRPLVPAGRHVLVVDGGNARTGVYSLDVELLEAIPPPANDTCAAPAPLTASVTGDTRGATQDFTPACAGTGHDAGDAVYSFTVTADEAVTLMLDATFDAVLALSSTCDGSQSIACADGNQAQIRVPVLLPGTYFVWVDGYGLDTGTYTLTTTRAPAPPIPSNDTCAAATLVDVTGGPVTINGSTVRATDDVHPAACRPRAAAPILDLDGVDVAYAVTVPAGKSLVSTLTPTDFDGALYVLAGCADDACLGASDASFQSGGVETATVANAGSAPVTLTVVVDSWRPTAFGAFSLKLETR